MLMLSLYYRADVILRYYPDGMLKAVLPLLVKRAKGGGGAAVPPVLAPLLPSNSCYVFESPHILSSVSDFQMHFEKEDLKKEEI